MKTPACGSENITDSIDATGSVSGATSAFGSVALWLLGRGEDAVARLVVGGEDVAALH